MASGYIHAQLVHWMCMLYNYKRVLLNYYYIFFYFIKNGTSEFKNTSRYLKMNVISLSSRKQMEQQEQHQNKNFTIHNLMLNKFLQMDEFF